MAAATVAGPYFSNLSYPRTKVGVNVTVESITIPTTSLDDANDITKFFPIESGRLITKVGVINADLDSGGGALDMDIVLVDDNGTTILYNAGTAFASAVTTPVWTICESRVVSANNDAYVGLKVNVAASTPQAGNVTLHLEYTGGG